MEQLSVQQVKKMLVKIADQLILKEEYLCQIDSQIGDGDHGTGMAIGARAMLKTLQADESKSIGELFQKSAMAMMNSMGGASGIIFSSLFLGLAKATKASDQLTVSAFKAGLGQAVKMIEKRGKASLGDKTMLDALIPAYQATEENSREDFSVILTAAALAAEKGAEDTKNYTAKFGRAKFLGQLSLGKQDAGATSIALIFAAMRESIEEEAG